MSSCLGIYIENNIIKYAKHTISHRLYYTSLVNYTIIG